MKIFLPGLLAGAVSTLALADGQRETLPCDTSLNRNETLPANTTIELLCFENEDEAVSTLLELAGNQREFTALINAGFKAHVTAHYFKTVDCGPCHIPWACEKSVGSYDGEVQWGANVQTFMGISCIFVYPLKDVELSMRCKKCEE